MASGSTNFASGAPRPRKRKWNSSHVVKIDFGEDLSDSEDVSTVVVEQASRDGRRFERKLHSIPLPREPQIPVVSCDPFADTDFLTNAAEEPEEEGEDINVFAQSDEALRVWMDERDDFLKELARLDGRADFLAETCCVCSATGPLSRCIECFGGPLKCSRCIISDHVLNPFHRIQVWTGDFFRNGSLRELGYVIQLGHSRQDPCTRPEKSSRPFTVLHVNGIHVVNLLFCGCSRMGEHGNRAQQLLRRRLFPATTRDPTTASTFQFLSAAHVLSVQSKLSLYDYYISIEHLTDATRTTSSKDRYQEFLRMIRMWRHLKLAKRGGRAHCPAGIEGTEKGELAVQCPACPDPSINLPKNWRDLSAESQFLYLLSIGMDVCFRFKRRQISSYEKDPELGPGFAYLVAWKAYWDYLESRANENNVSTCTGFSALEHASSKFSKGYAVTGIVAVTCCHEFVLPEGAGPTQKGEKQSNVDYVVGRSTSHNPGPGLLLSYDIMCQWIINLLTRLDEFPVPGARDLAKRIVARVVPKFHLAAHKPECRANFSLNFEPGAGRKDMEGPERTWFGLQGGGSTKDQGPGFWSDTMDDKFAHWNWTKLVSLGALLKKKYIRALAQSKVHEDELTFINLQVPADVLKTWTTMIKDWEKDRSKPNPYYTPFEGPSEADIRRRFALEEEEEHKRSKAPIPEEGTRTKYIRTALDLEEAQRRLRQTIGEHKGPDLPADVVEQRTVFRDRLLKFRQLQRVFQPEVIEFLLSPNPKLAILDDDDTIHSTSLLLPSSLPKETRSKTSPKLVDMEKELRVGQCQDALSQLRDNLHSQSRLTKDKYINVRHQVPNTRARAFLNRVSARINMCAEKYRVAYDALTVLDPDPNSRWRLELQLLKVGDVQTMEGDTFSYPSDSPSEVNVVPSRRLLPGGVIPQGSRTLSWIWAGTLNDASTTPGFHESFRIEWSKAYARNERWKEELLLLREEARRTLVSLEVWSGMWNARGGPSSLVILSKDPAVKEGLRAYACHQAHVFTSIRNRFQSLWNGLENLEVPATECVPPPSEDALMELQGDDI